MEKRLKKHFLENIKMQKTLVLQELDSCMQKLDSFELSTNMSKADREKLDEINQQGKYIAEISDVFLKNLKQENEFTLGITMAKNSIPYIQMINVSLQKQKNMKIKFLESLE